MGLEAALISQLAGTAGQTYSKYNASRAESAYAQRQADMNIAILNARRAQELRVGAQEESILRAKGKALIGEQRAALAGTGVDVDAGSAAQVPADTLGMMNLDILRVRNNAMRAAWGMDWSAEQYRQQARFSRIAAKQEQANTLLTGAASAAQATANYGFFKSYYDIDRRSASDITGNPKPDYGENWGGILDRG